MTTNPTALTLEQAQKAPRAEPLWCINTAQKAARGPKTVSDILLSIPKTNGTGQPDTIRIPQSWLPFNLDGYVKKEAIFDSADFRRFVTTGFITLITPEDAKALMSDPDAETEQKRINDAFQNIIEVTDRTIHAEDEATSEVETPESIANNNDENFRGWVMANLEKPDQELRMACRARGLVPHQVTLLISTLVENGKESSFPETIKYVRTIT